MDMSPAVSRVHRRLLKAQRFVAGQRRRFERGQQMLVRHAAWLQPGDWVPVPPALKVWRHSGASLPLAVVAGGGKAGPWVEGGENGPILSRRRRLLLGAFSMAGRVQRIPQRVRVPTVTPSLGRATAVIKATGERADFVALEPAAQRALRLGRPGSYDKEYTDVRERYMRFLPAPGFSVSDDGSVLFEEWCKGEVLSGLSVERRVAVTIDVLERYSMLIANEAVPDEGTVWQALPRLLDQVPVPAALQEPLADRRVRCVLDSGLLAPVQGSLVPENILVDDEDLWRVIDFDSLRWLPIWREAAALLGTARLTAGMDGKALRTIGAALDNVWAAAGVDEAAGLTMQHWTALAALRGSYPGRHHSGHEATTRGPSEPDPAKFAQNLAAQARRAKMKR